MPKQVIWSSQSENDLLQILDYLHNHWELKVAVKFIDIIDELTNRYRKAEVSQWVMK